MKNTGFGHLKTRLFTIKPSKTCRFLIHPKNLSFTSAPASPPQYYDHSVASSFCFFCFSAAVVVEGIGGRKPRNTFAKNRN